MTLGPHCGGCPLQKLGFGFASTDGNGKNGVLIVAEALGREEAEAKRPLVGPTGQLLNRMISRTEDPETKQKLRREDFLLTNIVWCRPPDNVLTGAPYEHDAIDHCSPYLRKLIQERKPRAILALGNQPLRWFTGQWGIEKLRGYIFQTAYGPVIPTYHPSYIMRGKFSLTSVWRRDLLKALFVARHGVPKLEKKYVLRPTPMEVERYRDRYLSTSPLPVLAFDIETPHSSMLKDEAQDPDNERVTEDDPSYTIDRVSFCFEPGQAITMPWSPPYSDYARDMLGTKGDKTVWNRNFDVPRLVANRAPVGGRIYDGMDAFHFLEPALPMGLKYAATIFCPDMPAWKLESRSQPEWYSAADSDVLLRCYLGTRKQLEEQGKWHTFERHFVDLALVLDKMSKRGVLVDQAQRKAAREDFEQRLEKTVAELQPLIPMEVKPKRIWKLTQEQLVKRGKWKEQFLKVTVMEVPPKPRKKKESKSKSVPLAPESSTPSLEPKTLTTTSSPTKKTRKKRQSASAVEMA